MQERHEPRSRDHRGGLSSHEPGLHRRAGSRGPEAVRATPQGDRRGAAVQRRPHLREFHPALGVRNRPPGRRRSALPTAGVRGRGRPAADHRRAWNSPRRTAWRRSRRAGTVVVPAWRSITSPPPAEALDALRRAHEEGARIVGLCTGAFVLAAAGLLDGRPATTHWMYAPTLAKRYPSVHVDPRELFVDDGDVLTSAGTAAGIDLCLHIVRTDHGNEAAGRAGPPARRPAAPQRAARSATSTGLYQRRSAPTRSPRSSPGRWSTSTSSSTWRRWRHART